MFIRNKHKSRFTQIPNAIFEDQRISIGAKGLLVYLLSRPPNWSVQHKQLQRALGIGRKLLTKLLNELAEAGYVDRDEYQGRDELNRFMPYDYTVRDIPETAKQAEPVRALQDKYTPLGERARAEGKSPVFVGSKPHLAWLAVRGVDGMPGFVDEAFINGKPRQIVWMDSVYPGKRPGEPL
jgi:hypothetical protein